MSIEIIKPTPELEKTIDTYIPAIYKYKTTLGYTITADKAAKDPYTGRMDIIIASPYAKINFFFQPGTDCKKVKIYRGGL